MHRSQLWEDTISDVRRLENLKLFSLGHNCSLLMKLIKLNSLIYGLNWRLESAPNGTFGWSPRTWSSAMPILPVMFSKFATIGPLCSCWTSTNLIGEFDNIVIDPLLFWFQVPNNLLFYDWLVTKFDRASSFHKLSFVSFIDVRKQVWFHFLVVFFT